MIVLGMSILEKEKHYVQEDFALGLFVTQTDIRCVVNMVQLELQSGQKANKLGQILLSVKIDCVCLNVTCAVMATSICCNLHLGSSQRQLFLPSFAGFSLKRSLQI